MKEKEYNDLLKKYGAEELANSFVFPNELTADEKQKADKLLADELAKQRGLLTGSERIEGNLLQLRFQLESLIANTSATEITTGDFIKRYLKAINKTQVDFAHEISVAPAIMSQYVNNRRLPSESIMVRFEIHSGGIIPAEFWLRLIAKEKANKLKENKALRRSEKKFVKGQAA